MITDCNWIGIVEQVEWQIELMSNEYSTELINQLKLEGNEMNTKVAQLKINKLKLKIALTNFV